MLPDDVQSVDTRFGQLAYRTDGARGGTPLLLLQRYRGTMDDWDPAFISGLAKHHHVIRFDSAGVGWSEGETPDTVAGMAEVAGAFVEQLGLSKVDVLGWSLGGYVGQVLALDAPTLVRRLIIAGSGPGGVSDAPPADPRVDDIVLVPVLSLENLLFLFAADTDTSRAAMVESQTRIAATTTCPAVTLQAAERQWKAIRMFYGGGETIRSRLPELMHPILVANGVDDLMIPALNAFVISQEAPDAKLILYPDAGHGFLFPHATSFLAEVEEFLQA